MKKTPNINPESQDVAELQAMVKALMASEIQLKQERQSLLEQLKLAFDRQFARRSEALNTYNESQGDLFNEVECEAAKEEEVEVVTTATTRKKRGKRKPLPKTLPREVIELDLDDHEKQCSCCNHELHKIGEDRSEKLEFSPAVLKVLEYVRPKYAVVSASKLKTTAVSFKSQRRKVLSLKASRQKACWPISSLANTNTQCHFTAKSRCLLSRESSYREPPWQGGLSKSVKSSNHSMPP